MYIIKIPSNVNKLDFVNKLLNKLLNVFNDYELMNCTESPLNEYAYFEYKGMYYRKIMRENSIVVINEANYVDSYEKENLMSQGISLQEYIEMNMLFELEKILVVSKFDEQIDSLLPLITISICPDGLNEVHFSGQETLLNNLIMLLKL